METKDKNTVPYPNIPPVIETDEKEYRDTGIISTVAIAGHPLHPAIVLFPIAFLTGALGSDLGYWLTKDPFWARGSLWLIGVGLLTGVLAAISGFMDFLKIKRVRDRSAGWLHMAANVLVMVLSAISFLMRLGDPATAILPWGLTISAIVGTLLGISGWLGGELTFRHKIGVIGPSGDSPYQSG